MRKIKTTGDLTKALAARDPKEPIFVSVFFKGMNADDMCDIESVVDNGGAQLNVTSTAATDLIRTAQAATHRP